MSRFPGVAIDLDKKAETEMKNAKMVTVAEVQAGDRDAFARLFEQNREKLLAVAHRLTSSKADASDAVQDAFISILVHHDTFQGAASPSTWAYRVTVNATLMRMRSARRRRADSLAALPAAVAERVVADARGGGDVAIDESGRRALRSALDEALSTLKPLDREIVNLRLLDELSTEDVADRTGLSATAVKTRLHRARARLASALVMVL